MTCLESLIGALLEARLLEPNRVFVGQQQDCSWAASRFAFADDPQLAVKGHTVVAVCDYCEGQRLMRERAGTLDHVERLIRMRPDLHAHVQRVVEAGEYESADTYIAALVQRDEIQRRIL